MPRLRHWVMLLALSGVAAAALRANEQEVTLPGGGDATASAASARATDLRRAAPAAPLPTLDAGRLEQISKRHLSYQPPLDPFAVVGAKQRGDPTAAPVAAPEPAPTPPAAAPALPFRFLGSQEADGARLVFLEQQTRIHIVRIGETVADGWRLDGLDERAVTFTYVPLGQQRTLALGSHG